MIELLYPSSKTNREQRLNVENGYFTPHRNKIENKDLTSKSAVLLPTQNSAIFSPHRNKIENKDLTSKSAVLLHIEIQSNLLERVLNNAED